MDLLSSKAAATASPPASCAAYEFTCSDGSCVEERLRCDDNYDCADGSDELDCGNYQLMPLFVTTCNTVCMKVAGLLCVARDVKSYSLTCVVHLL